jgi:hypothetical protein
MRAEKQTAPSQAQTWLAVVLTVLALVPVVMWPGDVPWTTDEPRLIAQAWHSNHARVLASCGLFGNFGLPYGPLPTQIYQVLLLFTHDLSTLVVLRGLLCGGVTAFSLLWLARTLRLPGWFAAAVLVAPYVTNFHRILWDASFAIPLSALTLAAFADFLSTGRARSLRVCLVGVVLLPLIHPQGLPLSVALAAYFVWRKRSALRQDRRALAWLGAGLFVLHATYLPRAIGAVVWRFTHASAATYPGEGSRGISAFAPLLGARLLAGREYAVTLLSMQTSTPLGVVSQWMSQLIYPLLWLGIGLAAWRAGAVLRRWRSPVDEASPASIAVRDEVSSVLLVSLILQALLFAALRVPPAPQYFFASFATIVFFAWLAVEVKWLRALGALYGAACLALTLTGMQSVHLRGYETTGWLRLWKCAALAQALNRFSDTEAVTDVATLQEAPQCLRALRLLYPPVGGETSRASGRLFITLRWLSDTPADELALIELAADEAPPPNAKPLDLAPLPRDWVPDPSTW